MNAITFTVMTFSTVNSTVIRKEWRKAGSWKIAL